MVAEADGDDEPRAIAIAPGQHEALVAPGPRIAPFRRYGRGDELVTRDLRLVDSAAGVGNPAAVGMVGLVVQMAANGAASPAGRVELQAGTAMPEDESAGIRHALDDHRAVVEPVRFQKLADVAGLHV